MTTDTQKNILVVDSQKQWREYLTSLLGDEFRVISVENYDEAISQFSDRNVSIHGVITEICLDEIDEKNDDGLRIIEKITPLGYARFIVLTRLRAKNGLISKYKRASKLGVEEDCFFEKVPEDGTSFDEEKFIEAVRKETRKSSVYVFMPFAKDYISYYEKNIKIAVEDIGLQCEFAKGRFEPVILFNKIFNGIRESAIIIADFSEGRPDVYLEAGIAYAKYRSVIIVSRNEMYVPELIKGVIYIPYRRKDEDHEANFEDELKRAILDIQARNFPHTLSKVSGISVRDERKTSSALALVTDDGFSQDIYNFVIQPVSHDNALEDCKILKIHHSTDVLNEMWRYLNNAKVIFVDFSTRDPLIYFLAGLACGLGRNNVVYIAKQMEDVPYCLRTASIHYYKGAEESRRELTNIVRNVIGSDDKIEVSKRMPTKDDVLNLSADVLLVTATDTETRNLLKLVRETLGREPRPIPGEGVNTYWSLGNIGSADVLLVQSEIGPGGPGGSTLTIVDGIKDLSKPYVIMVGIAFGVDSTKQQIGDVLISKQILDYELQRVGSSPDSTKAILVRGNRTEASPRLLGRFRAGEKTWKGGRAQFGLVLSGAKLIDNMDFREEIRSLDTEAIGGEMEGAGLYAAADREKTDWILVKGICDWADGNKEANRQENQTMAASNAASFVLHVLQQGGFKKPTA